MKWFVNDVFIYLLVILVIILLSVAIRFGFTISNQNQQNSILENRNQYLEAQVQPLAADLTEARTLLDSMVSFNNLLIRDLEDCQENN